MCNECGKDDCECCAGWKDGSPASAMAPKFVEVLLSGIGQIQERVKHQRQWLANNKPDIADDKELYLRGEMMSLHMIIDCVLGKRS